MRSAFYDLQVAAEIYINVFHYPDNHSFASKRKNNFIEDPYSSCVMWVPKHGCINLLQLQMCHSSYSSSRWRSDN